MSDDADRFEDELLSDDSKWWEFLDPETYQIKRNLPVQTRASSAMIDWSKKKRPRGPTGFGYFHRCGVCSNPCPPDFTFCVYCGGVPRTPQSVQTYAIIIKELESTAVHEAVAELIAESSYDLSLTEVYAALGDLPAVFNVHERKSRVAAMLARFAELGVYANSFKVDDPSVPWFSETIETIGRSSRALLLATALVIGTLAAALFWSPWAILIGLAINAGLLYRRLLWYREHYEFDVNRVLDRCAGFDGIRADVIDRLTRIRNKEMKRQFTVCLMEYYTLHTQFRAYESEYGDVLLQSGHALRELMDQILNATGRYADLEFHIDGIEPAALNQRMAEAAQRLESASPAEAKFIQDQLATLKKESTQYEQMRQLQREFQRRLTSLAGSMEALRERVASVRRERDARFEEIPMEDILRELDDELDVFVQTAQAIEQ